MSDLEASLRAFLEQTPEAGKGYPVDAPSDAAKPNWVYQVLDDTPTIAHSGKVVLRRALVQVTVMANDYQQAKTIQHTLRGRLDGFKGMMGETSITFCKTATTDNWADVRELPVAKFDITLIYLP